MELPPTRYVRTADGVDVAYVSFGEGRSYLRLANPPFGVVSQLWELLPAFPATIGEKFTWVTYDARGTGLSQREVDSVSPETMVADAEAVLDVLPPGPVVLNVPGDPINLAAALSLIQRHAGRFSHVIADAPWTSLREIEDTRYGQAMKVAKQLDWDTFTDVLARVAVTLENPKMVAGGGEVFRHAVTSDVMEEYWKLASSDVSPDDLRAIQVPVLVVAWAVSSSPITAAQRVASLIPGAEYRVSEDPTFAEAARFHLDFLRRRVTQPELPTPLESRNAFRTILFTDVVSSTPLLTQLRDARMREVMRDHDAVLEAAVTGHGGRVVKTIGDAFMAEFAVPSAAVEAAIEAQRAIREKFADSDVPVRIRIGINAGEPIEEEGDLHGASVVIAKRLESAADTNGILVSDVVKQMVTGKDFDFEDRGPVELKGFDEPVRAWAVRWE